MSDSATANMYATISALKSPAFLVALSISTMDELLQLVEDARTFPAHTRADSIRASLCLSAANVRQAHSLASPREYKQLATDLAKQDAAE